MHPPVTHVVELENNRIRLAAVDARMLTEVLPSSVLVFLSGPIVVPSDLGQLVLAIPQVPVVFVFPHAGTTPAVGVHGYDPPQLISITDMTHPGHRYDP